MREPEFRPVEIAANLLAAVLATGWLLALALSHVKLVTQPGPHEINEPSVWFTTFLFDQGRNPYSAAELPGAAQFFGPLYHWLVLALKPIFGIGYDAHRFLNLLCIAGSLWLIATRMARAGAGLGIALLSTTFFYWMCLQNIMVTARPDAPGLLFFLLGIIVPWERNYSPHSTLLGLACALLAFHCKAYFVLAALPVLAGFALVQSWRRAAILGVAFAAALTASVALLSWAYPLYWLETFVMQRNSVALNTSADISPMHTAMLFERAWPFFLFLVGAAVLIPRHARDWVRHFAQREPRAIALAIVTALFLLNFALVYFYMGHNGGALFTYHLHLVFPPLLLLTAFTAAKVRAGVRVAFLLVLAGFSALNVSVRTVEDNAPACQRLTDIVMAADPVLDSTSFATEILARLQRPVHNSGFSLFLPMATMHDRSDWDPNARAIRDAFEVFTAEANENIARRAYAVVLTSDRHYFFGETTHLEAHYEQVEEVFLPMYFGGNDIQVWKPRAERPLVSVR